MAALNSVGGDVLDIAAPASGGTSAAAREPDREDVLDALDTITASADFVATERSRRLLRYLVTEALDGRKARIKAYSIATEAFGRPPSFDPQKDPIVRIEAARLRRELEHYYLTGGSADRVIIEIPKGAYVPEFSYAAQRHETPAQSAAPAPREMPRAPRGRAIMLAALSGLLLLGLGAGYASWGIGSRGDEPSAVVHVPGLIVKPLADLSRTSESALMAQGLTERIIEKSSRFKELSVIAADSGAAELPPEAARYEFGGTLRLQDDDVTVQVRLLNRTDGRVIWADSFDVPLQPRQLSSTETEIANQIAARVAAPTGFVFEAERSAKLDSPPDNWDAYLCTLRAYAYRATFAANQFTGVRDCLEKAVAEHPDYATAWALLSLADVDEARFFYPPPGDAQRPALERAYEAAHRSIEIDPENMRGQQAMMMTLFFRGEQAAAMAVGEKALAINPNDVEFKGEFGFRLAVAGNWSRGCSLIREALDSSARKIAYYKTGLALCAYMQNDMAAAANLIGDAAALENPAYHVIAAAISIEAGDTKAAAAHRDWLVTNVPSKLASLIMDVPNRLLRPEDRARFLNSLRKAGLLTES